MLVRMGAAIPSGLSSAVPSVLSSTVYVAQPLNMGDGAQQAQTQPPIKSNQANHIESGVLLGTSCLLNWTPI